MTATRTLDARDTGAAPPHDLDAEVSVLGSMLLSRPAIHEARAILEPDDFWRGAHRTMFEGIVSLSRRGEPVDEVTLADELERLGTLDGAGGVVAIHNVVERVPSAASVQHYAWIVRDHAVRRRLQGHGADLIRDAGDPTISVEDTLAAYREGLPSVGRTRFHVLDREQLRNAPPPRYIIEGILRVGFSWLFGPTNGGKTFGAVDISCSVATGRAWHGHKIAEPGPVIYITSEGDVGSFNLRVEAWEHDRRTEVPKDGLITIDDVVNLTDLADLDALTTLVAERGARLLVVDTWARNTPGVNENRGEEQSVAIHALDRLRVNYGCSTLGIHHTGHEEDRMRGWSGLKAAADAEMLLKDDGDGTISLTSTKVRNGRKFPRKHFRIADVPEVVDPIGEPAAVLRATGMTLYEGSDNSGTILAWLADRGPVPKSAIVQQSNLETFEHLYDSNQIVPVPGAVPALFTLPERAATFAGKHAPRGVL